MATNRPERDIEDALIAKLKELKYEYRSDIRDRATLEANFRSKFEALNGVKLTDGEFQRLHDEIDALRHSVECPNLSPALHAMVNRVLRGACEAGGIIHPELKD